MTDSGTFAAVGLALYAAHHVGDYWVQRDVDARRKGLPGPEGRLHCLLHVVSYLFTQAAFLLLLVLVTGAQLHPAGAALGLAVSGVTHYIADRRAPLIRIAGWIPGKADFLKLGTPRPEREDNPQLATGAWALDQSWHIFWGVFVAALVMVAL